MYSGVPAPADRWRRMTSDLSLIEVTAAPGKPIAPSGEPGDEFMPLMKSMAHHLALREVRDV